MAGPRPVTDADRQQLSQLHAAEKTRNDIAREMGRSPSTISKLAAELGLSFDRAATKAATEARKADAAAKRASLALALLDDAHRLREALWKPCKVYNFGGRDNTYEEREHDEPDFAAKLKIMQAVGVAVDRALRLDEHDAGDSGRVGSLLGNLFTSLQTKHGTGDS